MRTVWVVVTMRHGCKDEDGAVGVWEATIARDLAPGIAAGAALDIFHQKIGLTEIDNYEIATVDPATSKLISQAEDFLEGSGGGGELERIAERLSELKSR